MDNFSLGRDHLNMLVVQLIVQMGVISWPGMRDIYIKKNQWPAAGMNHSRDSAGVLGAVNETVAIRTGAQRTFYHIAESMIKRAPGLGFAEFGL